MVLQSSVAARYGALLAGLLSLFLVGCDTSDLGSDGNGNSEFRLDNCTIPNSRLVDGGVPKDGIPALNGFTTDDERLVKPGAEGASYLADGDRVIGLLFGDNALAVPHNILWHHEIINIDAWEGRTFAVTYCPLTGTSLAFDRSRVDGAEFGVSGLLFNNNLVMYDRRDEESLWPQMNREANCGARVGAELEMLPVMEMTWDQWKTLHPDTKVVSNNTGFARSYGAGGYPYGDYERVDNERLLFDIPIDDRRLPKERILGIPEANERGLALPFGELDDGSTARVIAVTVGDNDLVVFWRKDARGAMAYHPTVDGQTLSFSVDEQGRFVDEETDRTWTLDGRATDGSARLDPVNTAYVSFWFAWAATGFHSETRLWEDQN